MNKDQVLVVYEILTQKYFPYRKIKQLTTEDPIKLYYDYGYIKLLAQDGDMLTCYFIISNESKNLHSSGELTKLLTRATETDNLILIVEEHFFNSKNLIDAVKKIEKNITVRPFEMFLVDIPSVKCIPKHSIASKEEVDAFLSYSRLPLSSLPRILEIDPPVAWLGAKPNEFIRIDRDSEATGVSYVIRVVEAVPLEHHKKDKAH
jgi:DNA-directed RNA polymerase subunit H (RpoH/RPB5)